MCYYNIHSTENLPRQTIIQNESVHIMYISMKQKQENKSICLCG